MGKFIEVTEQEFVNAKKSYLTTNHKRLNVCKVVDTVLVYSTDTAIVGKVVFKDGEVHKCEMDSDFVKRNQVGE